MSSHSFRPELILLTDGSVNPRSKVGYGAFLLVSDPDLSLAELKMCVRLRRFEQTSSTKLELQTLLWALGDIQVSDCKVKIFTDSQNIIGLPGRRARLEQNDFQSSQNRPLNHAELYREFYRLTDQLDCELVHVRGHQPAKQKGDIDRLFALVDRASRKALREDTC